MRENMQNAMTLRINAGTLTGTCIPHVVKYRAITSSFFFPGLWGEFMTLILKQFGM